MRVGFGLVFLGLVHSTFLHAADPISWFYWAEAQEHVCSKALTNENVYLQIAEKIKAVKAQGKTPVLIVDLDDTLFSWQSRFLRLLHAAGKRHGASFRGLDTQRYLPDNYKEWLPEFLASKNVTDPLVVKQIMGFMGAHSYEESFVVKDNPYKNNIALVHRLERLGAKIVIVTGRYECTASYKALENIRLRPLKVFFNKQSDEKVQKYKARVIAEYFKDENLVPVMFFDDKLYNLDEIALLGYKDLVLVESIPRARGEYRIHHPNGAP